MPPVTATATSGRATRGRTPLHQTLLNGAPFDIQVSEASFTLTEGEHDTAVISVTSATLLDTTGILNSAISFFYGMSPRTEVFHGYVTAVKESDQTTTGSLAFQLQVMGATKEMQTGSPYFWTDSTIVFAAQQLVSRAALGFISHNTHPGNYKWPALAQTDETDWRMVNRLANRCGWSIYNRFGVVMCYDPLKLFVENGSYTTLISDSFVIADPDAERTLLEFTPAEEADISLESMGVQVAYFGANPKLAPSVKQQNGTFKDFRFAPNFVIRNSVEADIYVGAADSTTVAWDQRATARILGNACLYPGMNVDVLTVSSGSKLARNKYNGRWFIRGVQHIMDRQQFQTLVMLCRPDAKTPVTTGVYKPFWQSSEGKARPSVTLVNKKWSSSWKGTTV